jgi:WbqC-like protein family
MAGKKVAILQSNYIPWKGYFDIINSVDEFIFLDEVQFTRRDWRNRNLIKTANGLLWLTIPVNVKNNFTIPINEVVVSDQQWRRKHWASIQNNYSKAPFFKTYKEPIERLFLDEKESYLSKINFSFIEVINDLLGIKTRLSWSTDHPHLEGKNERLISLCEAAGATEYLSGPAAKEYIQEEMFLTKGITVRWMEYSGYQEYPQFHPPFEHGVSILDLLFHTGNDAKEYMKSFKLNTL